MGMLCLCTFLDEIYLEHCVKKSRKTISCDKVSSCTSRFKTGVYNYSNFSTFKINTMGSDVHSLLSFTYRTVFFKLVRDSGLLFYASQNML